MRAFVAVDLAGAGEPAGTSRAPEHLTLQFLGEIAADRVVEIEQRLDPVAGRFAPFDLELAGVGAFPSPEHPRVVWRGVTAGRPEIEQLAHAVRGALATAFPVDRDRYVPHLTLFRVRNRSDAQAARALLDGTRPPPPASRHRVASFALKESVLGPGGAVHRTRATFALRG